MSGQYAELVKRANAYVGNQAFTNGEHLIVDLASALATLTQDAKRYQFLKPLYTCIDFEYGDSSEGTTPSIVFAIPPDTKWSGDLDASIDAAMEGKADGR